MHSVARADTPAAEVPKPLGRRRSAARPVPHELRLGWLKLLADDAPPAVAALPEIVPDDLVAERSGPSGPGRLLVRSLDILPGVVDPADIDDPVAGIRADDPSGEGFAEIRG